MRKCVQTRKEAENGPSQSTFKAGSHSLRRPLRVYRLSNRHQSPASAQPTLDSSPGESSGLEARQ